MSDLPIADQNYTAMQTAHATWAGTVQKYREYKLTWEDAKSEYKEKEIFVREQVSLERDAREKPLYPNEDLRNAEVLRRMAQRFPQLVLKYQASERFEREYRLLEREQHEELVTARITVQFEAARMTVVSDRYQEVGNASET